MTNPEISKAKVPRAGTRTRKKGGEIVTNCEIIGPTIVELIKAGMTANRAAQAVGIGSTTISNWVRRGLDEQFAIENGVEPSKAEAPYLVFVESIAVAEAESMGQLVLAWVREARKGDWKAAQQFLARRWPQEWGDSATVRVEMAGAGGGESAKPLNIQEDEDRKRAILAALVESGDLPVNVLGAWDENNAIIDGEVVETKE